MMSLSNDIFIAIVFGFVVSWIPRVAPFVLTKYKELPNIVLHFLKYLPLSILFALTFASLFSVQMGSLAHLKGNEVLASLPTLWVGIRFKNLFYTVLTGIICMFLLKLIM